MHVAVLWCVFWTAQAGSGHNALITAGQGGVVYPPVLLPNLPVKPAPQSPYRTPMIQESCALHTDNADFSDFLDLRNPGEEREFRERYGPGGSQVLDELKCLGTPSVD